MSRAFFFVIFFLLCFLIDESLLLHFSEVIFPMSTLVFTLIVLLWNAERIGMIWLVSIIGISMLSQSHMPLVESASVVLCYLLTSRLLFTKQSRFGRFIYVLLCTMTLGVIGVLTYDDMNIDMLFILAGSMSVITTVTIARFAKQRLELMEKYG
ncbi:MAG: hypothetical protein O3B64_01240 [bacterium]|nr:hypothetical protein [bacterium]MDA1024648.1 hypothetical protein [bacterium]